jgi:hypothetical protein
VDQAAADASRRRGTDGARQPSACDLHKNGLTTQSSAKVNLDGSIMSGMGTAVIQLRMQPSPSLIGDETNCYVAMQRLAPR